MTKHPISDLVVYVHARHEAQIAASTLKDYRNSDSATVDYLHRQSLAAVQSLHAAMVTLGINPLCPHPRHEDELREQINAAEVSIWHLRRKERKTVINESHNR